MTDFLAIFDVDGTLVDSQAIITATMARAFVDAGLEPPTRAQTLALVGISLPQLIAMLLPDQTAAMQQRVTENYRRIYTEHIANDSEARLYPGVGEGLARLKQKGITLGVATGKSQKGLDRLVAGQGWGNMFATLQCADHHPSKPHRSMVDRALLETATEAGRAVMIGDTTFDMEMGAGGGVATLGVAWGYHAAEDLLAAGARSVLPNFGTLVAEIERMAQ
ncbi:phosphoglycolate phosphatase [Jannaschia faecimaris]|uniref:Phosphoglycolate phosphatase n=1 Tax=Jannaschia faecimaris TaxID=1244108 RepID=A0A1H3TS65_9RHOB|nr:HAD-IA family hydrolase [Jannaschia faecimaris]SDZ53006.1 phosphoglycolate phosphatase [Jannaschia faecimaris]